MVNADRVAMQRCSYLLNLAKQTWKKDEKLAKRYVQLTKKIAMRHRLKLGRRSFCKKCNTIFIPGETLKVRISAKQKAVLWKCLACDSVLRFPLRKKSKI